MNQTPTPATLASDRFTVICDNWQDPYLERQVYQATVCFDERASSIRCLHNHKSADATVKCQKALLTQFNRLLPRVTTVITVYDDVYEANAEDGPIFRFYWQDQPPSW